VGAAAARINLRAWQPVQTLKDRFPDLARHFIFEYYPWYGVGAFRHWDQDGHIAIDMGRPMRVTSNI
jgi:hypothetical protein